MKGISKVDKIESPKIGYYTCYAYWYDFLSNQESNDYKCNKTRSIWKDYKIFLKKNKFHLSKC